MVISNSGNARIMLSSAHTNGFGKCTLLMVKVYTPRQPNGDGWCSFSIIIYFNVLVRFERCKGTSQSRQCDNNKPSFDDENIYAYIGVSNNTLHFGIQSREIVYTGNPFWWASEPPSLIYVYTYSLLHYFTWIYPKWDQWALYVKTPPTRPGCC